MADGEPLQKIHEAANGTGYCGTLICFTVLKGIVQHKMKILLLFSQPHVISNMQNTKINFEEC